jgi:peroxiredoxin
MITLYNLLFKGLAIAALGFAAGVLFFLAWALIGGRGDRRARRLRLAASSAVLCVTSVASSVGMFYLLLALLTFQITDSDFQVPYAGWSNSLGVVVLVLIYASAILLIRSMWPTGASRRRRLLISFACLVVTLSVYAGCYALINFVQVPAYERFVMIENRAWKTQLGEPAPDISVVLLDGSTRRLSDLRGQLVVVNFFATWCGPCNHELPHLQALWEDLKANDGATMLVIDREEDADTVTAFLSERGFTFPAALDPSAEAFKQFADEGIPRTYLIGRDGTILFQTCGFSDDMPIYAGELATLRRTIESESASSH